MIGVQSADRLARWYDHSTERTARRKAARQYRKHGKLLTSHARSYTGIIDAPGVRDFRVGAPRKRIDLPVATKNWYHSGREMTDQGQTMQCSAYGGETCKGTMDSIEAGRPIYHDPEQLWEKQMETGASEKYGDTIQNMLKNMHKHGFVTNGHRYTISEYRRFQGDTRGLMLWLALGHLVVTGVHVRKDAQYGTNFTRWEFSKDGTLNISSGQKIGGHLMAILDYETRDDGVWFFLANTYGVDAGKLTGIHSGGAWIHESEIGDTMSKYVIFDTIDAI